MIRAALACGLLAAGLAAQAGNVAFVADVRGAATIEGNGPLTFLQELAPGTRVLLGTGGMASITFAASGAEYTVVGPGEFSVTDSEVKADKGKAPAKRAVGRLSDPGVVTRVAKAATASVRMRGLAAGASPQLTRLETLPASVVARVQRSGAAAKTFPERVMHALLLHEVGAEHDAREAWAALARERPDLTALSALGR